MILGRGLGLFFKLKPERISKFNVKLDTLFIYVNLVDLR